MPVQEQGTGACDKCHFSSWQKTNSCRLRRDFLRRCAQSETMYKGAPQGVRRHHPLHHLLPLGPERLLMTASSTTSVPVNEIFWSLNELGNKMILELGCVKTVAGTTWVNPLVVKWKSNGWYCRVIPEKESFRFRGWAHQPKQVRSDHPCELSGHPCLLRISVVAGNCPPLLSKPVCTALGLMVDTSSRTVSSKKFAVKRFGLGQSAGGHYVLPIDQLSDMQPVPHNFRLQ